MQITNRDQLGSCLKILTFLFSIYLTIMELNAQFFIISASRPDVNVIPDVTVPTQNTSIAVGPNLICSGGSGCVKLVAVAYDNSSVQNYYIKWYDLNNNIHDSALGGYSDPDIAYTRNHDKLVLVGVTSMGEIGLHIYSLFGVGPPATYNTPIASTGNPDGEYPNLDINSHRHPVVCFEDANDIYVTVPDIGTGSPDLGTPEFVGSGIRPDVVVLDDSTIGVITYVENGDLKIIEFDYQMLYNGGGFSINNQYSFPASGQPFDYPRIAAARNSNLTNKLYYSVVAERNGTQVVACSFATGNVLYGPYTVDSGLTNCVSRRPVVTYNADKIVYAWSEEYDTCSHGHSSPDPYERDVLYREYNAGNLSVLNSGNFYHANDVQGNNFNQAVPALTCLYDADSAISSTSQGRDFIIYNNADSIFRKARGYGSQYRLAPPNRSIKEKEDVESFHLKLVENPTNGDILRLAYKGDITGIWFRLFNQQGQEVLLDTHSTQGNEILISTDKIDQGVYILRCSYQKKNYQFRVMII